MVAIRLKAINYIETFNTKHCTDYVYKEDYYESKLSAPITGWFEKRAFGDVHLSEFTPEFLSKHNIIDNCVWTKPRVEMSTNTKLFTLYFDSQEEMEAFDFNKLIVNKYFVKIPDTLLHK